VPKSPLRKEGRRGELKREDAMGTNHALIKKIFGRVESKGTGEWGVDLLLWRGAKKKGGKKRGGGGVGERD